MTAVDTHPPRGGTAKPAPVPTDTGTDAARHRAADLLAALRDGRSDPDAVLDAWPRDGDRGVRVIGGMVEAYGEDAPGQRALLDRCEAFLRSGLPYEWPGEDFAVPAGAGPRWLPFAIVLLATASLALGTVAGLLLGAVLMVAAVGWWPLDRRLRRRWRDTERALDAAGERDAWPFLHRDAVPPNAGADAGADAGAGGGARG